MHAPATPLRSLSLADLMGVVALLALVVNPSAFLSDPGVGWHLKTGEWILNNQAIPTVDPFLWGEPARAWISNQWLSDLVLWCLHKLGGFPLILAVMLPILIIPYVVFAPRWASVHGVSAPAIAIGIFLCMGLGRVQWYLRPVMFSFLFFALTYLRAHAATRRGCYTRSDLFLLPGIFLLWANMHPAFPLGLLLVGISALEVRARVHVAIVFFSCLAATVCNPYGFGLHLSAAGLVGSDFFMNLNTEWLSPDFHDSLFAPLLAVLLLILTAPNTGASMGRFERIAFAIFIILALRAGRYFPFLAFTAIVPTALALQGYLNLLSRWNGRRPFQAFMQPAQRDAIPLGLLTTSLGGALILFVTIWNQIPGWSQEQLDIQRRLTPQAVAILKQQPPNSKIFHTPDWGGFITWSLWPYQRAWIDDRNEMNGQKMYEDFLALARLGPRWSEVLTKHHFDLLLLESSSPLYQLIKNDPSWQALYTDRDSGIFKPVAAQQ